MRLKYEEEQKRALEQLFADVDDGSTAPPKHSLDEHADVPPAKKQKMIEDDLDSLLDMDQPSQAVVKPTTLKAKAKLSNQLLFGATPKKPTNEPVATQPVPPAGKE